jgi:hypothetical protein
VVSLTSRVVHCETPHLYHRHARVPPVVESRKDEVAARFVSTAMEILTWTPPGHATRASHQPEKVVNLPGNLEQHDPQHQHVDSQELRRQSFAI